MHTCTHARMYVCVHTSCIRKCKCKYMYILSACIDRNTQRWGWCPAACSSDCASVHTTPYSTKAPKSQHNIKILETMEPSEILCLQPYRTLKNLCTEPLKAFSNFEPFWNLSGAPDSIHEALVLQHLQTILIPPWTGPGSLLDISLHFCYNKTLIRIKNDHF